MLKINDKEVAGLPITKKYAENQDQYITVPCNFEDGIAAMEFELSDEDIEDIVKHKKIFLFRVLGSAKMQPFYISVDKEEFRDALYYNRQGYGVQKEHECIRSARSEEPDPPYVDVVRR